MTAKKSINLEKSLADLEALVEELESGDLPLDKAMKKFARRRSRKQNKRSRSF
jgi:exonuclease VII small subunit